MTRIIKTRDFNEVSITEESIINFPEGLYGFEDHRKFALIAPSGENKFPMWLQSIDELNPCFIVFDPLSVKDDYGVDISPREQEILELEDKDDIRCVVIAVIPDDYTKATVNLKCPVLINIKKNIGMQIILDDELSIREPLFKKKEAQHASNN